MKNENLNIANNSTNNTQINKTEGYSKYTQFINQKLNFHYILICLGILIPFLIFVLILYIYYRFKKRKKYKKQKEKYNINRIHKEKPKVKESYDIIMNTSGLNNLQQNTDNLNEIKVHNMKEEMNSIINSSGSSSGRRKREKRKIGKKNKNVMEFDSKEGQQGIQNELKEQIKQFVIEEHNSNNNNENNNENFNDKINEEKDDNNNE